MSWNKTLLLQFYTELHNRLESLMLARPRKGLPDQSLLLLL
jgi:hypothetical protein